MNGNSGKNIPTVLIVLGATGDLAEKKIFPSLYNLYLKGKIPKLMRIIGFSRRDWNNTRFKEYVIEILQKREMEMQRSEEFLSEVNYQEGNFENKQDFRKLAESLGRVDDAWSVCSNKLFYLAVPPIYYENILKNLSESGLTKPCSPEEGWTRVIVEKPFGKDLKTAARLDELLGELFKEEQIFRIDHYLGKDVLQNILAFRFSNNIFESSWSNKFIDSIEIKLLETGDVSGRGNFYDGVGALRDVGQNHLLQMLALTTMENPASYAADAIRNKREELLKYLKPLTDSQIANETFRSQYIGYQDVEGVNRPSNTETYFKTAAYLDLPKWRGVKITLESGKAMKEQKKEIVVRFHHPSPCLCPPDADHQSHNKVIFALEPKEEITFRLWYKRPGYELAMEKRSFDLPYRKTKEHLQYIEEYERLLLDCISGDQTLFVTSREMESTWKYIDPILKTWRKDKLLLNTYQAGEDEVRNQSKEFINKTKTDFLKEIGIIGLGKMGSNLALQLIEKGWRVAGFNRTESVTKELGIQGLDPAFSVEELVQKLASPKIIWLMLPAGEAVDKMVDKLSGLLGKNDIVIDAGNSYFEDDKKHEKLFKPKEISFVDVGVSGGPGGARYGACLMVGGEKSVYDQLMPLYIDLSVPGGHEHFEGIGAGHFVKMVHNAIEYGMMQAIAEGFDLLKNSGYKLHLKKTASVFDNGSVIESRLIGWMKEAYEIFGDNLGQVSGKSGMGGTGGIEKSEAKWAVDIAKVLNVETNVIEESLKKRVKTQEKADYQGKVINALRNRFGSHKVIRGQ